MTNSLNLQIACDHKETIMIIKKHTFLLVVALAAITLLAFPHTSLAQEIEVENSIEIDDLQIDVKSAKIDTAGNAIVELFLISYQKNPRELKINTFSSTLLDEKLNEHFYSEMQMGNVLVLFEQKQNYINYLIHTKPVLLKIQVNKWPETAALSYAKLVFQESGQGGKFLETLIPLQKD